MNISTYSDWITFLTISVPIFLGGCKWLHSVYNEIKLIRRELTPNGGSSLRDAINRVDKRVEGIEFAQRISWDFSDVAMFKTDTNGSCIWANQTYLDMIKRPMDFVLGHGWESCVHIDDRQIVAKEWEDACQDGRNFDMVYRIVDVYQNVTTCRVRAYGSQKTGYIGFIYAI